MSFRRFNPFNSTSSFGSRRDSTQSTRPPTYIANATTVPTCTPNEPRTASAYDRNESVRAWSSSLPSASSVASQDSDTVFDQAESLHMETASIGTTHTEIARPADPRYVYYRLYTMDRAIPLLHPVSSDSPYLGRTLAKTVAPPHTAHNIKQCLLFSSGYTGANDASSSLCVSPLSPTPLDDTDRVSILECSGPGSTPEQPMALVINISGVDGSLLKSKKSKKRIQNTTLSNGRQLYYRVYTEDGIIETVNPVHSDDPFLGCISAESVAPPLTAKSLKRCLSSIENIHRKTTTSLFISSSSQTQVDDNSYVSILEYPGPGCTPEQPMVLVVNISGVGGSPLKLKKSKKWIQHPTLSNGRQLYYRVYTEDGIIETVNPVHLDDSFLGRISAEVIAPPLTAVSLKRCLSSVENIGDKTTITSLFISASSQTPMNDEDRVSILEDRGPGYTPNDPIALVAKFSDTRQWSSKSKKPKKNLPFSQGGGTSLETRYIYYRVYESHTAVPSKHPVDSNEPSVGRINVDCIPPPHTAKSITRCISKIEKVDKFGIPQLFTSMSDESPIGDGHVSILTSNRPGPTPEEPMAFVVRTKQVRVIYSGDYCSRNPGWLTTKLGEILHVTGDLPQNRQCFHILNLSYEARNAAGKVGFVHARSVELI